MEVKLLEIRDRGTAIPAMAVRLAFGGETFEEQMATRFLLRRAGYSEEQIQPVLQEGVEPYVVLWTLTESVDDGKCTYDPFQWRNRRTMTTAHLYIRKHWAELRTGDVVDVEFINGEVNEPKISERHTIGHFYQE